MGSVKLKSVAASPLQSEFSFTSKKHLYVESTLFNEVYLFNDLPREQKEIWEGTGSLEFQKFCERFRNLCETLDPDASTFESWSERTTLEELIKPVMRCLGYTAAGGQDPWGEDESFTVREAGAAKVWRPDLIVVTDPRELKHIRNKEGQDKVEEARHAVKFPLEAKYWGRIEEKEKGISESSRNDKKSKIDSTRSMEFDDQCLKYMSILGKRYGILTDGKIWRIYNSELSSGTYKRFYQFKLGSLIRLVQKGFDDTPKAFDEFIEAAKYFYFFFSPSALAHPEDEKGILDNLVEYSKRYAASFQEDLKLRFVNAMKVACNGFEGSQKFGHEQIALARSVAESHLFNILLIRYCESRSILPVQNASYFEISITGLLNRLTYFNPDKELDGLNKPFLERFFKSYYQVSYDPKGTHLYTSLLKLTKIIQSGIRGSPEQGFEIKGFKESLFSKDEWKFAADHPVSNKDMIAILFELGYVKNGTRYQQIPYNYFSARQLGSIYESFLEFKIERATENLIYVRKSKRWEPGDPKSDKVRLRGDPCVYKGELFFAPNNKERKDSGSYYTPDCVVKFIVAETLTPLVSGKKTKDIRKLRICDPAMGSGHFLSAGLSFLTDAYIEALDAESNFDIEVSKPDIKQELLHNCIFGVDLNARAVKLAKMSLWMETASPHRTLEPLDDQLKHSNSLTDRSLWVSEWESSSTGFDAIVGNPPYLGEKGHKEVFQDVASGWLSKFYVGKMDLFYFFFHAGLEVLKDGGRFGVITTNYFTTALGAKKLRRDLFERSSIDLLMNLNELKVFGEASGQHNMITVLTKGESENLTRVVNSAENGRCTTELLDSISSGQSKQTTYSKLSKQQLFEGEDLYIRTNQVASDDKNAVFEAVFKKLTQKSHALATLADIKTGLRTGLDRVSDKHLEKFPDLEKGAGVFVVSEAEFRAHKLKSSKFVRPLFKNSDIKQYRVNEVPSFYVFYISNRDKLDAASIEVTYLQRFKKLIEAIRWNEPIKWFSIVRPRSQAQFQGEKIVCPQRSVLNTFGFSSGDWYASSDVYYIRSTSKEFSNRFLLGYLNSKLCYLWLYIKGKRKGHALELYQKPLSEILVPEFSKAAKAKIEALVNKKLEKFDSVDASDIDEVIFADLGFSKAEVKAISDFYSSNVSEASLDGSDFEAEDLD